MTPEDADWMRDHPERRQTIARCRQVLALQRLDADWVAQIMPTQVAGHYEIRYWRFLPPPE